MELFLRFLLLFNAASSAKQQKVQDSKITREFETWWTDKYGMINKRDKAVCVLMSEIVVSRIWSVKRHFQTNHKFVGQKSQVRQKELITNALEDRNEQSTPMIVFVGKMSLLGIVNLFKRDSF